MLRHGRRFCCTVATSGGEKRCFSLSARIERRHCRSGSGREEINARLKPCQAITSRRGRNRHRDLLHHLSGWREDQQPAVLRHHSDPARPLGDRHRLSPRGQRKCCGQGGDAAIRHTGDKQAHDDYDTPDHGDHQHDHQPFQESQRGRQLWLDRSIGHDGTF